MKKALLAAASLAVLLTACEGSFQVGSAPGDYKSDELASMIQKKAVAMGIEGGTVTCKNGVKERAGSKAECELNDTDGKKYKVEVTSLGREAGKTTGVDIWIPDYPQEQLKDGVAAGETGSTTTTAVSEAKSNGILDRVPGERLEGQASKAMGAKLGYEPDFDCPDSLSIIPGKSTYCTMTADDGAKYTALLTTTDFVAATESIKFDINIGSRKA